MANAWDQIALQAAIEKWDGTLETVCEHNIVHMALPSTIKASTKQEWTTIATDESHASNLYWVKRKKGEVPRG